MAMRILVNEQPHRTLALASDTHVLFFKHTQTLGLSLTRTTSSTSLPLPNSARKADTPRCMVEFAEKASADLKGFRTLTTAKGTLGLITLNNDVFICVVTGSAEVATVRPGETVQKIFAVEFYCLNRADYDHGHPFGPNPLPGHSFQTDEEDYGAGFDQTDTTAEHPFHALKKLLSGGNFYYSFNFDLTRRLQDRSDENHTVDISSLDEGLLWNSYMINPLLSFRSRLSSHERIALDRSGMLTSVIRGFAQTLTIPPSSSPIKRETSNYPAMLTVISRLSARRAGTRFNSRGLDDSGNVANFVETETIFWTPTGLCFSYVQVRGSVPVFWESSSSLLPGQQKIAITRSPEATQPSFDKHFERLEKTYGVVHIVNLLSESKPGEVELTEAYREHVDKSPLKDHAQNETSLHDMLRSTEFDFHEMARQAGGFDGAARIRPLIGASAESFVYFLTEDVKEQAIIDGQHKYFNRSLVIMQQHGVFRVNCLDCLDRTNLVQGILSQMALELFLEHRGEKGTSVFWLRHQSLWADNGDALSKIYAGTGALKSSFTRHGKMSLGGFLSDARKSATRLYVNNFEDKARQNTVDVLLGRLVGQAEVELFDPINEWVTAELNKRKDKFESMETIRLWYGSYNVNGRMLNDSDELHRWLPNVEPGTTEDHDMIIVAMQEMVELNPQQIMSTDPGRRMVWEAAIRRCLNGKDSREKASENDFVLLRSGQLVGAALMIFVRASFLSRIRNVEGAIKKTGMSGIAGNKGAVAIRMDIEGTSVCIVTSHLAAGFGNYDERNRDYNTISSSLRFQRDRSIDDHDYVFWAGDFNYRIGLGFDKTRMLAGALRNGLSISPKTGETVLTPEAEMALGQLYENDQLNIQMVMGHCFPYYNEGRVRFLPTYKYDVGTDEFDTSEKQRIPAWTDRILWRVAQGSGIRQLAYNNVMDLFISDHKPVYAHFEMDIKNVNEKQKTKMAQELYEKRVRDVRHKSRHGAGGDDELFVVSPTSDDDEDAEDLMGYQSIQEGIPPASSDRRKWWLDGDKPVRSTVGPPRPDMVLNEKRNGNPWRAGVDDDWVEVEKAGDVAINGTKASTRKPTLPPPRRNLTGSQRPLPPPWNSSESSVVESTLIKSRGLPQPPPPRRTPYLARTTSNASTATKATMATAKSSDTGMSEVRVKKVPPLKPSKPSALSSNPNSANTSPVNSKELPNQSSRDNRVDTSQAINSASSRRTNDQTISSRNDEQRPPLPTRPQPRSITKPPHLSGAGNVSTMPSIRGSDDSSRPTLPPRLNQDQGHGLLDQSPDEARSMASFKPLEPSRR